MSLGRLTFVQVDIGNHSKTTKDATQHINLMVVRTYASILYIIYMNYSCIISLDTQENLNSQLGDNLLIRYVGACNVGLLIRYFGAWMLGSQFINAQLVVSICFHHDNSCKRTLTSRSFHHQWDGSDQQQSGMVKRHFKGVVNLCLITNCSQKG